MLLYELIPCISTAQIIHKLCIKFVFLVQRLESHFSIFFFFLESVQSTDPGPELYPVVPGTNWILCSPLLDKKKVSQAGWFISLRDEWTWIAGIGRPAENRTDSWDYRLSKEYTRYGFFGSNFLEIQNVTKEDNGSIYKYELMVKDTNFVYSGLFTCYLCTNAFLCFVWHKQ